MFLQLVKWISCIYYHSSVQRSSWWLPLFYVSLSHPHHLIFASGVTTTTTKCFSSSSSNIHLLLVSVLWIFFICELHRFVFLFVMHPLLLQNVVHSPLICFPLPLSHFPLPFPLPLTNGTGGDHCPRRTVGGGSLSSPPSTLCCTQLYSTSPATKLCYTQLNFSSPPSTVCYTQV